MNRKTLGKLARDSRKIRACIYEGTNGKLWKRKVCDERLRKTPRRSANDLAVKRKPIGPKRGCSLTPALTNAKGYIRYG